MKICPACKQEFEDNRIICPKDGKELIFKKTASDLLIGLTLDNKYKIERKVGRGGMGSVYTAQHVTINKQVAIKVLSRDMTEDPNCYERFKREAITSGRIKHPNAVPVTDFGQTETGIVYLVMEYVDGPTLRKILEREKRLSPERTVSLAKQICAGIAAAHRANVVHRDLKPDNVMIEIIDGQEVAKVLDFGIAKLRDTQQLAQITKTDSVLGTPHYMSPEQCSGGTVDHLSDIYSLGVMAYEMLAGHVPFQAASAPAIIVQHVTKDPQPLNKLYPNIPEPISHVVMRALEKQPSRRQQSASELASQLEAALAISGLSNSGKITSSEPAQWRVVFQGVLDNSESGRARLLDGLQRSFGISQTNAQELLKGRKLSVKKTPSQQEATKYAEKLRAIGADVIIEAIPEKLENKENTNTIAYQHNSSPLRQEEKTLSAQSTQPSKNNNSNDIALDPLLMLDGSEMLNYVTENYAKSKAKALSSSEIETIQVDSDTANSNNSATTSPNQNETLYQTTNLATDKNWDIDVNGFIYENQTAADIEAMIRVGRLRHTHRARQGKNSWQDIGSISSFRQIIEEISPHIFQPLEQIQVDEKRSEEQQAGQRFLRRFIELCVATLLIYIIVNFTMQYSQRRLLEDELRVVLGDSSISIKTLRKRINFAIEQRGLEVPKEDIHITVDPPQQQVIIRVDYKRTILGIPLSYQAKRGTGGFKLPISELIEVPEGELDIIGLPAGELDRYRREQALKKASEKLATYEGEKETLAERSKVLKELEQFQAAVPLFDVTSIDDKGNQIYSKSIKINEQEYDKEQVQNQINQLKTKLTDLENTLDQQRKNKKQELENQLTKPPAN